MKDNESEFIRVTILESTIEAQVVDSILGEENIPHMIHSYYDTAYDGLFQLQKGWGELCALEKHRKKILEIVESIRSGENTFS